MARRLSELHLAVAFAVIVLVAIAGLFALSRALQSEPAVASGVVTVSLVVDSGSWTIRYGPITTNNNTAFTLLVEASEHIGFSVREVHYTVPDAVFVTAINGTMNGQGGQYWQYWVSGVYGDVGADHYTLHQGDVVQWRFMADQGGGTG
jgi:hypothetical protein